jgi:transcription initiation factor TFIIIB Brf1 subunit/transcription initiation factor TFIIB
MLVQLDYFGGGEMGDSQRRKAKEQTLVQTIVVLIRNTTWRCGKVEKSIVRHLYKRHRTFGKPRASIRDIMQNLNVTGTKKDECIDAIKRLEKRNIVKILPL